MHENIWDQMRRAVAESKDILRAADDTAGDMASLLRGRLRHVKSPLVLAQLKRELRDFDAVKGQWK